MEDADQTASIDEVKALREGIRSKYQVYHLLDKDRFPAIEYNTNRANYKPLRDSFEEEFYVVRGISRFDNNLHIPSTNTLALLFSDDQYLPGKKILNTCRSYADGKSQAITDAPAPQSVPTSPTRTVSLRKLQWIPVLMLLAGFAIYSAIRKQPAPLPPGGFSMISPHHGQTVSRLLTVEGKVSNADTVWMVVHPVAWDKNYVPPIGWNDYYIQPPISVDTNGRWKGQIYIGGMDNTHVGVRYQIRAFINPDRTYRIVDDYERYVFHAWPQAELATKAIEVVRGPEDN